VLNRAPTPRPRFSQSLHQSILCLLSTLYTQCRLILYHTLQTMPTFPPSYQQYMKSRLQPISYTPAPAAKSLESAVTSSSNTGNKSMSSRARRHSSCPNRHPCLSHESMHSSRTPTKPPLISSWNASTAPASPTHGLRCIRPRKRPSRLNFSASFRGCENCPRRVDIAVLGAAACQTVCSGRKIQRNSSRGPLTQKPSSTPQCWQSTWPTACRNTRQRTTRAPLEMSFVATNRAFRMQTCSARISWYAMVPRSRARPSGRLRVWTWCSSTGSMRAGIRVIGSMRGRFLRVGAGTTTGMSGWMGSWSRGGTSTRGCRCCLERCGRVLVVQTLGLG
jgi:hypothetical protein